MPAKIRRTAGPPSVEDVVADLQRMASKKVRDGMARYAIPSDRALGVSVSALQKYAKKLGRNHELANALWGTGWYEARMLACYVDDPLQVTPAQMDRWCRDFDNWAIVDTACFALFDRTPHAWSRVDKWARSTKEFVKRAAFALLWGFTVHDKNAEDQRFLHGLTLIESAATDNRHFVKKAVNMALRAVGKRSRALNDAAVAVARRLAESADRHAQWIGKHALRELSSPKVTARLKGQNHRASDTPKFKF